MNILYVAHYFSPNSAAGVTTREIVKMLSEKGHNVTLLAPSTYASDDSNAIVKAAFTGVPKQVARRSKPVSLAVSTLGYISVFMSGLRLVRREGRFDVIIAQSHATHFAPLISYVLSRIIKASFVIKIHDFVPGSATKNKFELLYAKMFFIVSKVVLSHADLILSPSTEIAQLLVENKELRRPKIMVFPNTISLKSPEASQSSTRFPKFSKGKKTVLWIGETVGRGLEVLLKALSFMENENVVLVVIGMYGENDVNLVKKLGLEGRVFFLHEVEHNLIEHFIDRADVCIGPLTSTPYTYGVLPRKVLEYMARGKPVIAAKNTVTKDLAVNGVSAVLVDSNNEKQVASALTMLLHDVALSTKMGKEAQAIVAEKFNSEKLSEKLNNILPSLCH